MFDKYKEIKPRKQLGHKDLTQIEYQTIVEFLQDYCSKGNKCWKYSRDEEYMDRLKTLLDKLQIRYDFPNNDYRGICCDLKDGVPEEKIITIYLSKNALIEEFNTCTSQFSEDISEKMLEKLISNITSLKVDEDHRRHRWTLGSKTDPKVKVLESLKSIVSGAKPAWKIENQDKILTLIKSICNQHRHSNFSSWFFKPASAYEYEELLRTFKYNKT